MRCRTARIVMTRQLREQLPPDQAAALTRHLAGCAACRPERAELHRLRGEAEMLKAAAAGQALELQTVLNSRSWHYTRPLRGLRRILGRGR